MLREGHGGPYGKSQQWKKEESEKLRGDGGQIKFIDLSFFVIEQMKYFAIDDIITVINDVEIVQTRSCNGWCSFKQ